MKTDEDRYAERVTSTVLAPLRQRLVLLPDTEKLAILQQANQAIHGSDSRARAATIITQLERLNPDVAREFRPKEDAVAKLNLRMICSTSAPRASSFVAISYCWHKTDWPLPPAATPVSPGWEISERMMKAVLSLESLRESPDVESLVWLDKLCINQTDGADIIAHLGAMDLIYRSARRVAILLEDVQLTSDEEAAGGAFARFYQSMSDDVKHRGLVGEERSRFIDEYFPRESQKLEPKILAAVKPFALKMLNARWYSRAWCAHESRMMKHQKINNPLFLCFGANGEVLSFEFRFIHYLGLYLLELEPAPPLFQQNLMQSNNSPTSLRQLWNRIQLLMPDRGSRVSSMQHLVSVLASECWKKGDLMSIALNTAGIPLYYAGDGALCVEEVIWKFSLLVLAAGDLSPLVTAGKMLRIPTTKGPVLSWAIAPDQGVLDDELSDPRPGSITAVAREYIELDLLLFESRPQQASDSSREQAGRLIEEHGLDTVADQLLDSLEVSTQSVIRRVTGEMDRNRSEIGHSLSLQSLRHNLLALALDNGLDWFLEFPTAMETSTVTWMHGTLGTFTSPSVIAAAQSLLVLLSSATGNARPRDADHDQEVVKQLALALTTLLDPRLYLLTPNPRRVPVLPKGSNARSAILTPSPSNRSYIAVPTCLAHLPGWFDRAWVIEPFDPATSGKPETNLELVMPVMGSDHEDRRAPWGTGSWKKRRRQMVFGAHQRLFEAEDGVQPGVVLLRRQKVYGVEDYPWREINLAMRQADVNKAVSGIKPA
ncbi:uncharacterized protein C8A04DRAFT_14063 [Dichotomopilus funicola]|uniref:Heterokaryon incompatibility domain-containing protein n=1 Tax=Dichotomopilus funicola TaxID=1934379 RepID=A0AAN6ZKZ6_9PEZI|nr:hypothetical protein C8A04DRAFT_14063 [Dichotomopilus funicola]